MTASAFIAGSGALFTGGARRVRTTPRRQFFMAANLGRTAVITGASGGIGAETALKLKSSMPRLERLVLCAREVSKAEAVAKRIREVVQDRSVEAFVVPLELASLASVRECAEEVSKLLNGRPLDVLLNNAGVMACPLGFTTDGIEMQYGVNHIGSAALTLELLPQMRASDEARAVFVSSSAIYMAGARTSPPFVEEKVVANVDASKYEKWKAYGDSKLAMSMFARALALTEPRLTSVSLHPGVVMTELGRHVTPRSVTRALESSAFVKKVTQGVFSLFGFLTPEQGALMSLDVIGASKGELTNGAFYQSRPLKMSSTSMLSNDAQCLELYENTVALLKSRLGEGSVSVDSVSSSYIN